jgi:hypothetical protein
MVAANSLAYYGTATFMAVNVPSLYDSTRYEKTNVPNKLECLFLASLFRLV